MFRKILIANRGEIACRVADTCRRLGIATVAVHSPADALARHVGMADEAVALPGDAPADSYLRGDLIVAAARDRGAEAVHPGYGFLSENPDFAEAVTAAGMAFVGPPAAAIRAMGLKDAAKALMARAGVPVVPGWQGADQDPARLADEAARIGWPVLIKAVAGGGGKGMRRVDYPAEFAPALAAARSEAEGAFGNPAVLIEKCIERPRHIEMQIFGDGQGAVHLFERDCSLQRRHQKVIEEAPAPGMTPELRAAMGAAAVRAAEAIGYAGAGTVEFIVDAGRGLRPDGFWFMEMNTRLQVEHPVTEQITGIDLVEWQIRVAAGEGLPMRQEQIRFSGHAFEARLYAEDVPAGFLPATGRLSHLRFGPGLRVETGVRAGDIITPWYDPMIAKVIAAGPTRDLALARLRHGLAQTEVAGTVTNLAFLRALAAHPGLVRGETDTGLIARDQETLAAEPVASAEAWALAAVAALGLDAPGGWERGFALWTPLRWQAALRHGGERATVVLEPVGGGPIRAEVAGQCVELVRRGDRWLSAGREAGRALMDGAHVTVLAAHSWEFLCEDPGAGRDEETGEALARAPMPGLVRRVLVACGQEVAKGTALAVIEAMKMEHTLCAARDGRVAEVLAAEGAQVEAGAPLVRIEPAAGPAAGEG